MVNDDRGEVVLARGRVRASRLVQVGEQVLAHVEALQGELDVGVDLGAGVGRPAEPLHVEAEHVREAADPELLGRGLLRAAAVAVEAVGVRELLHVREFFQAVCNSRKEEFRVRFEVEMDWSPSELFDSFHIRSFLKCQISERVSVKEESLGYSRQAS